MHNLIILIVDFIKRSFSLSVTLVTAVVYFVVINLSDASFILAHGSSCLSCALHVIYEMTSLIKYTLLI